MESIAQIGILSSIDIDHKGYTSDAVWSRGNRRWGRANAFESQ